MEIQIKRVEEDAKIPIKGSEGAGCYDLFANSVVDQKTKKRIGEFPVSLRSGEKVAVSIGVAFAIPGSYVGLLLPRGGLGHVYDINFKYQPGIIDSDFRGVATVVLSNEGRQVFIVKKHMKIAQILFIKFEAVIFREVSELPATERGEKCFGSTGL